MPSYKTAFGSFLKQEDLQGKDVRVVISDVGLEDVKDVDKTEKKLIMRFAGKDKTLILNRTNCEAMEAICGTDDYGAWIGHAVMLWTDPTVKFGGKTVGGLRIRAVTTIDRPKFVKVTAPLAEAVEKMFIPSDDDDSVLF